MDTFLVISGVVGLIVSVITFLLGRAFAQSDKILEQKRIVYSQFLEKCPSPQEAHLEEVEISNEFLRFAGTISIYGSPDVVMFLGKYMDNFGEAQEVLAGHTGVGHPKFLELMTDYNRMIWAMRTDVTSASFYAPRATAKEFRSRSLGEV